MRSRLRLPVWFVLAIGLVACRTTAPLHWLGTPDEIAPGVEFYRTSDPSLVSPIGPIAVYLLRLDPARVRLESALAHGEIVGAETVADIAARSHAVAAINGGYFNTKNGEPVSVLKVAGELVSDSALAKGAVLITSPAVGRTELAFDQITTRMALRFDSGGREWTLPIDGVDTTRARGKLMLYTPAYHPDTDTAVNGTEWMLEGSPLKVREVRSNMGRTPIPRAGVALSYGGLDLPEALAALAPDTTVTLQTTWSSQNGLPASRFDQADHIVNGAGLLRIKGRALTDWKAESLNPQTFTDARHPRTLIGVDSRGFIWLAAIDGRQPDYSIGMTFSDLQRLCDRLDLTDALNLDGGGSTTMVVEGQVMNRPSDATGPRAVSDAVVVKIR
jgi:Phosphodiester glycosidase